eukprot:3020423-Heterocapsa_arctica.AAC.1
MASAGHFLQFSHLSCMISVVLLIPMASNSPLKSRLPSAVDRFKQTPSCDFLLSADGEEVAEVYPEPCRPLLLPDLDVRE